MKSNSNPPARRSLEFLAVLLLAPVAFFLGAPIVAGVVACQIVDAALKRPARQIAGLSSLDTLGLSPLGPP